MDIDETLDQATIKWLLDAIESAPNKNTLDGISYSLEWFYEQGMSLGHLEYFMKRINEAKKLKD